jgi:hypothetical protein
MAVGPRAGVPISLVARDHASYNDPDTLLRRNRPDGVRPAVALQAPWRVSRRGNQGMFRRLYPWMLMLGGVAIGLVASGRIVLLAQDRGQPSQRDPGRARRAGPADAPVRERPTDQSQAAVPPVIREPTRSGPASVQDVLLRPFRFSFTRPTALARACLHLQESLGVPVVLDVAALGRQDVDPDDTVQLELDGVRLKTGLKLLLDQVGLTYHVVPEDNLLIITDREGSEDPLDRIWNELRTLHRDLHDVQDAVDELNDALVGDRGEGPRVRKPTIIEEKPDHDPSAPDRPEGGMKEPKDPAQKPGAAPGSGSAPRSTPSRVPLANPRRSPFRHSSFVTSH